MRQNLPRPDCPAQSDGRTELEKVITCAGHTWMEFAKWAVESGNVPDADSLNGWGEVHPAIAKRLLRSTKGMLAGIATVKGVAV